MRKTLILIAAFLLSISAYPQARSILDRREGSITFRVDKVSPATERIAEPNRAASLYPATLAGSFSGEDELTYIGEDVLFQMLLRAWSQHRSVVLTPDAVWIVICQGFSQYVNAHSEELRSTLVSHDGKRKLQVRTNHLLSEEANWEGLIAGFVSEIGKYSDQGLASTLLADFSTTGQAERIASGITLMDTMKSYFDYLGFSVACGIPSVTLTGTPDDWQKVLDKTRALSGLGFDEWVNDLVPILEEFVKASKGSPDIRFWKDMVSKTRPRTIRGPSCARHPKPETTVDGWFLKFFPFDGEGLTPDRVPASSRMLSEMVCVPLEYEVRDPLGNVLSATQMELEAGILGVREDPVSLTLTPEIGWLVRIRE